jgi:hypothetical protein
LGSLEQRPVRSRHLVFAALALLGSPAALAADPSEIQVANGSPWTIVCRATLAHWFAIDLVEIEPGGSAAFALSVDRTTGMIAALNASGDAMPVELLFCGRAGHAYETRALLPLRETLASRSYSFRCRENAGRLSCQ